MVGTTVKIVDKRNRKARWHFHQWQYMERRTGPEQIVTLYPYGEVVKTIWPDNEICIICGKTRERFHDPK